MDYFSGMESVIFIQKLQQLERLIDLLLLLLQGPIITNHNNFRI